ncbi:unnamed protein product, partial [Mesorhabditis spiculigera]
MSAVHATVTQRQMIGMAYGLGVTVAIIANMLLWTVLKGIGTKRDHTFQGSFFRLARHLIVCNMASAIIQSIVAIPYTVTGQRIYATRPYLFVMYRLCCFIEFVCYMVNVMVVLAMSLNRLTVFLLPKLNRYFFSDGRFTCLQASLWIVPFGQAALHSLFECTKEFCHDSLAFYWHCSADISTASRTMDQILRWQCVVVPVLIIGMNCLLFAHIKRLKRTVERQEYLATRGEVLLLYQSLTMCLFVGFNSVFYNLIIPMAVEWHFQNMLLLTFLQNLCAILANIADPLLFMMFNTAIRERLAQIICRLPTKRTTTITSTSKY